MFSGPIFQEEGLDYDNITVSLFLNEWRGGTKSTVSSVACESGPLGTTQCVTQNVTYLVHRLLFTVSWSEVHFPITKCNSDHWGPHIL